MADIVHPGNVKSQNDGDIHFIGFHALCSLYGLNPHTTRDGRTYRSQVGDRNFYPRYDGKYKKVDREEARRG